MEDGEVRNEDNEDSSVPAEKLREISGRDDDGRSLGNRG